MLRLTSGRLAPWDVISSESKRNGRVEVIETVIRRMEQGMARWGIVVPSDDEEEQRTELALAFDDAEYQPDPEPPTGSNGDLGDPGRSGGLGRPGDPGRSVRLEA